jgi:Uma2 family endonuclease
VGEDRRQGSRRPLIGARGTALPVAAAPAAWDDRDVATRYDETITLPRAVRLPVELIPPDDFDPERLETWPLVAGRLEFVDGRLLYMPPCGDLQQDTVTDVVITLGKWVRENAEFVLGTNEAGMRLRGATRAADAAVWRSADARVRTGGLRRTAPVLAVEVAGQDESEDMLRDKARWYLGAGVTCVWLVLPGPRELVLLTHAGETRHRRGERIPTLDVLPGLSATVDDLFVQIDSAR